MINLDELSTKELLNLDRNIINVLKERNILRTNNNPVGDFAEKLFQEARGWHLENNSNSGYDAIHNGIRYQIKGRRSDKKLIQLGAIRNIEQNCFDYLAFVIFNSDYSIRKAAIMSYEAVVNNKHRRHSSHTNSEILRINLDDWNTLDIKEDVTNELIRTINNLR